MGLFSWIYEFNGFFRSSDHFQRLLSFGSSNGRSQALAPQTELQEPAAEMAVAAGPDLEAAMLDGVENSTMTGNDTVQLNNDPAAAATNEKPDSRSIAELAIPAVLSMGLYSSIPSDVQFKHGDLPLYYPLLAFIGLAVGSSLCIIFYSLAKSGGEEDVQSAKQKWMRTAIVFFLIAFVLRIMLLQVHLIYPHN